MIGLNDPPYTQTLLRCGVGISRSLFSCTRMSSFGSGMLSVTVIRALESYEAIPSVADVLTLQTASTLPAESADTRATRDQNIYGRYTSPALFLSDSPESDSDEGRRVCIKSRSQEKLIKEQGLQ